jgi:hypothetical protein
VLADRDAVCSEAVTVALGSGVLVKVAVAVSMAAAVGVAIRETVMLIVLVAAGPRWTIWSCANWTTIAFRTTMPSMWGTARSSRHILA